MCACFYGSIGKEKKRLRDRENEVSLMFASHLYQRRSGESARNLDG